MTSIAFLMGWAALPILAVLAYAFAHNPEKGLWTRAHRLDRLPHVMASRYVALGVLLTGILLAESLPLLALFFAVGAYLGLTDALIYRRAGGTVWPHAAAAGLGVLATVITLAAMVIAEAGEIGAAAGAATGLLGD